MPFRTLMAVAAAVAFVASPLSGGPAAAGTASVAACGYIPPTFTDDPAYEHCATDTNVWIRVDRFIRGDYERCVGPGRTKLDKDAVNAWYIGQLCSHPGDTRGVS
ncbi:DUF6355 family natural product biosynthesis protein [Nonomuraea sp. bgisy101]|uniref:DUF6355 family natural product biosynthesis protein n=1 Tax=Nonomuraea sp. bgisy101 TaxID=3413784 RepID=UPI003D730CE3